MEPRHVVILVFPGVQSLDVTGPLEVFNGARRIAARDGRGDPGYRITIAARDADDVRCSSGLRLGVDAAIAGIAAPIDTLVVVGGNGSRAAAADRVLVDWIARVAPETRRVASVCTGAFVLAAAGLLDGRRVTTHWASCDELARRHPAVTVDPEPIYCRDGNVTTSAGVTAGMDLALALVEEDMGRAPALEIARWLVMFLRRPGNQAQFSAQLSGQIAESAGLRAVQEWVVDHPAEDLSVEALAARAHLSPRQFARAFRAQVGVTPGRYVERVRVEAARRRLEDGDALLEEIAAACGFGTPETMRRTFIRTLHMAPAEYRRRFQPSADPTSRPFPPLDDDPARPGTPSIV